MSKVAYFAPYFWPEVIGSAPYCTDVARWLHSHGHEVEVVAFRPHYPDPDDFTEWAEGARDHETFEGMRISRVRVGKRGSGGFLTRLKNDVRYLGGALRATFRRDLANVDAVVAYVPSSLALLGAMALSWRTGARFTGVVHDIESGLATSLGMAQKPMLLWLMRRIEQLAFNRTDQLIVLSAAMKTELRDLGCVRPITALPIWSDTFPNHPIDVGSSPALCYSGNFGKKQNLDLLLPLIGMLSERRPEVRVILRGDGTERDRIQQQVEAMKTRNTVFLPLAPAAQFAAALQEARVHLVPQANNTGNYAIPSKVFSIMAAGRPFVCIAESGSPLALLAEQTGAGICVPPNDDEALFSTIEQLVTDVARCREMGEHGRAYVRDNLSRPKVLGEYERIILGRAS